MSTEKREVFISYHTTSSGDLVRKICAALEGAGIRCWYAPRDVGANYAQSIVEAIRGCRVFLLLLNEYSNMSAHVLNEVNCAFDRFKNKEDITLLPFRMSDCILSDDVHYYLGRIHIMDGTMPPEVLRVQELVDRISMILGKEPERTLVVREPAGGFSLALMGTPEDAKRNCGAPTSAKTYRITGSMVYPDAYFVGREAEMAAIHEHLMGVENKMLLVGMGGIGKSEIAKMYLKRHAADYDVILWVSYDGSLENTIRNDYGFPIQGLSRSDYSEDTDREYYLRKLRILKELADRRVLIVIDNFDVMEDADLQDFCSGSYGVLFTTRYHQKHPIFPEVEVGEMTDENELMAVFRSEYTRVLNPADTAGVKEILKLLNGHPLSIRLVASAMQSRRLAPERMLALLKEGYSTMAVQNAKAADIIFGRLRQVFQLSTLSEEEQYLLKNLSLISLRGIEVQTLVEWCGLDDFDAVDELARKSWAIYNPVLDEIHLHPLVSDLMAEALAKDPKCCNSLVESLAKACVVTTNQTWETKQMLHEYADTVYDRLPKDHPMRMTALEAKARLTMDMAMYEASSEMFREVLKSKESLKERLEIYHKLSHALMLSGDPEECRKIALEGCELVQDMELGQLSVEEGYYYNELLRRLTESNRDLGEFELAVAYGRKAVDTCDPFAIDSPQRNRGWTEYHLGRVLSGRIEHLDEAEKWIRDSIRLFEEVDDLWSANFSYDILGQIYMKRGMYEDAIAMNQKAWDLLLPYVGPEHADMGGNLERRGNIYQAMGEKEKATSCYYQAAAIYQKHNCFRRADKVLSMLQKMNE